MEPKNAISLQPKSKTIFLSVSDNNEESHYQGNVPMFDLRKRLEAFHLGNKDVSTGAIGKNPTPTRDDLTKLLRIELLEK